MKHLCTALTALALSAMLMLSGCINGDPYKAGGDTGRQTPSPDTPNTPDTSGTPSAPGTPDAKPGTSDSRPAWARLDFRHSDVNLRACAYENPDGVSFTVGSSTFTYFMRDSDIWYSGIVEFENTGSVDLTFETIATHLEDAQGNVLDNGRSMIAGLVPCQLKPGETGWIYINDLLSPYNYKGEKVRDISLDKGLVWVFDTLRARSALPTVRYDEADVYLEEAETGLRFIGTLTHTGESYPLVEDWVVLFDAHDKVLAIEKIGATNEGTRVRTGETLKIYDEKLGTYYWVHNKEITYDMVARIYIVTRHHVGTWYH